MTYRDFTRSVHTSQKLPILPLLQCIARTCGPLDPSPHANLPVHTARSCHLAIRAKAGRDDRVGVTGQLGRGKCQTREAFRGFLSWWDGAEDVAEVVFAARDGQRGIGEEGVEGDREH